MKNKETTNYIFNDTSDVAIKKDSIQAVTFSTVHKTIESEDLYQVHVFNAIYNEYGSRLISTTDYNEARDLFNHLTQ